VADLDDLTRAELPPHARAVADAEQAVIRAAKAWRTWLADDPDTDNAERDLADAVADLARVESGAVQDGTHP
jgi:hypothetical protein